MLRLLTSVPQGGGRRLVATALGVFVLGAGCGLAAAAVEGVSIPQLGINVPVPAEKAAGLERLATVGTTDSNTTQAPVPTAASLPISAQMLGHDVPIPVAPALLRPRNGWLVSDGRSLVAVYSGAAGSDRSVGRVVIVRQDLLVGRQTVRILDVPSTGALTITRAPVGSSVETSAQRGSIRLRTASGRQFVLDLGRGSGKVSLDAYKAPVR